MTVRTCATCGNEYDKAFTVTTASEQTYVFDSLECAATKLAPRCGHCDCRVLGHGVEANGTVYCCAHCAAQRGEVRLADRV